MATRYFFLLVTVLWSSFLTAQPQKDIFIPIANRSELKIDPEIDTLEAGTDYVFKYTIAPGYKISQSFFDIGLATLYDSFIVVTPKAQLPKGTEKAALRFIIINKQKTRILLKAEFVIKSDGELYPIAYKPKTNIIKLGSGLVLERNKTYNKSDFLQRPIVSFYEKESSDTSKKINAVRLTVVKKRIQKNMRVLSDTLSGEMIREIKKLKGKATIFLCLEIPLPRNKIKTVWSRFALKN